MRGRRVLEGIQRGKVPAETLGCKRSQVSQVGSLLIHFKIFYFFLLLNFVQIFHFSEIIRSYPGTLPTELWRQSLLLSYLLLISFIEISSELHIKINNYYISNSIAECIDHMLSYFGKLLYWWQWGFESWRKNWNFFHSKFYSKILKFGLVRPKFEKNFSIRMCRSEIMNK